MSNIDRIEEVLRVMRPWAHDDEVARIVATPDDPTHEAALRLCAWSDARVREVAGSLERKAANAEVERQNAVSYYEEAIDRCEERVTHLKAAHNAHRKMSISDRATAVARYLAAFKGHCYWDDHLCRQPECKCERAARDILDLFLPGIALDETAIAALPVERE
jgi:hypothetical protein